MSPNTRHRFIQRKIKNSETYNTRMGGHKNKQKSTTKIKPLDDGKKRTFVKWARRANRYDRIRRFKEKLDKL